MESLPQVFDYQPYIILFFGTVLTLISSIFLHRQSKSEEFRDKLAEGLTAANIALRELVVRQNFLEQQVRQLSDKFDRHLSDWMNNRTRPSP